MPTVGFRVVRSRRRFINAPNIRNYLSQGIDSEVKPHFLNEFRKVVANWEHRPEFQSRRFITTDAINITIFPAGAYKHIWVFVTGGTRPHTISRRDPRRKLAFLWGGPGSYVPKTRPGGSYGGPGHVVGGVMHFTRLVRHPGTVARDFERIIRERNKAWYSRTMENMWRRAIRRL